MVAANTRKLNFGGIWTLIKDSVSGWIDDKVPKAAAALAYYTAISLAPLLVISIKIVGVFFRHDIAQDPSAQEHLHQQLSNLTDPHIADTMQDIIGRAGQNGAGTLATIISILVAIFGASGVFAELQDSLNTIWDVRPKPGRGVMGILRDRFLSVSMVLGVAFLLLVSMVLSTVITGVSSSVIHGTMASHPYMAKTAALVVDLIFSTCVITVLFAAIFRMLPDAQIDWKDVWLGALVTALLFQIGKYGLSLYLGKSSPGSAYGVAGSIVAMLVWFYYSAQILFFGAEFTRVYAERYGTRIIPTDNAERLTDEMRRKAGIPRTEGAPSPRKGRVSSRSPAGRGRE